MPVTQTMTFSATLPTAGETPTLFNTHAIGVWNELKNITVPALNVAFGQMNTLETNVNNKETAAAASATAAALSEAHAETAKLFAQGAANFKGVWNSTTDYLLGTAEYNGEIYLSIQSPNVNHLPTDLAYWRPLLKLDELVSRLSATAISYNTDGTLSNITYTGGYKSIFAYTAGVLTSTQYTGTDGATVYLTLTYGYTSGNLTSITRA